MSLEGGAGTGEESKVEGKAKLDSGWGFSLLTLAEKPCCHLINGDDDLLLICIEKIPRATMGRRFQI
jgi:hypothetical protein